MFTVYKMSWKDLVIVCKDRLLSPHDSFCMISSQYVERQLPQTSYVYIYRDDTKHFLCVCFLQDWLNHKEHIVHRASCRLLCRQ